MNIFISASSFCKPCSYENSILYLRTFCKHIFRMTCSCVSSSLNHDTCDSEDYESYEACDRHELLHRDGHHRDDHLRELKHGLLLLGACDLLVDNILVPYDLLEACDPLVACVHLGACDRLVACDLLVDSTLVEACDLLVACDRLVAYDLLVGSILVEPYLMEAYNLAFHLVAYILVVPFHLVACILVGIDLMEDNLVLLVGNVRLASFLINYIY